MFPREAFEADIGLDDEFYATRFEAAFELMPVIPVQHHSIMRDGYIVTVDGVMVQIAGVCGFGFQVDNELVAEEIKIDPLVGAPAFFTAEYIAIECAGFNEVIDGNGDVKGSDLFHVGKNTMESSILLCKI